MTLDAADNEAWLALVRDPEARRAALSAHGAEGDAAAADEAKGESALLLARAFAHPRDARIRFHESSHSYFLDGEKLPLSVSGFYGRYFGHFDAAGALRNLERWRADPESPYCLLLRHLDASGVPRAAQPARVREIWAASGAHASGAGTALHRAIELRLNGVEVPPPPSSAPAWRTAKKSRWHYLLAHLSEGPRAARDAALNEIAASAGEDVMEAADLLADAPSREWEHWLAWRAERAHLLPVRCEMNVWDADLRLAGQLDALFWDSREAEFVLVDWKRVERMEREAYGGRTGKPPFHRVADTNYGHYAVQQNTYAALLRKHYGVSCARMILVQLHPCLQTWEEHEIPDLSEEVEQAFLERTQEIKQSSP
jgi:hypothetical protein